MHRNSDVHGASAVEAQQKALAALHTQVETAYREFDTDPFVVSPKHNSLFTKKSLQDRLRMSHDSLADWLRSVKEAVTYQEVIKSSMAKATKNFAPQSNWYTTPVHLQWFHPLSWRNWRLLTTVPRLAQATLTYPVELPVKLNG